MPRAVLPMSRTAHQGTVRLGGAGSRGWEQGVQKREGIDGWRVENEGQGGGLPVLM